jgi:transcriptional regulator with XRE-family HTH domain
MNLLNDAMSFFDDEKPEFFEEMDIELLLVDLASEFIKYRVAKKMSQKDLAKMLDISQAMVSKLESGDYNPTIKFLWEICQKLDWDFDLRLNTHVKPEGYHYSKSCSEPNYDEYKWMGLAV